MKFFFPDSQDFVDPTFDFQTERRSSDRLRSRDDRYAHEIFARTPFDGILVSKAIVEGVDASGKSAKYSLSQRHRLLRNGVREFLRLDDQEGSRRLATMGDCGAFSYAKEPKPPFSVDEVIDFYEGCGFDLGISVDHVILLYDPELDSVFPGMDAVARKVVQRQEITLELAREFKQRHRQRKCRFEPVGVAQGWSPKSYAKAVSELQKMGYRRIALGGMVPLRTPDILGVLEGVSVKRRSETQLHLLGVTRTEQVEAFDSYGVTSFDTTSPFLRSFKDGRQNYFTKESSFTAIRIPQVQGNARLGNLIRAGIVDQRSALRLEERSLSMLRAFDRGEVSQADALKPILEYEALVDAEGIGRTRAEDYARTLTAKPWKRCKCEVCKAIGVDVIIFRGSERNKRRGFHNLFVLYEKLNHELGLLGNRSKARRFAS